jgi:hypothetical protein
VYIKNYNTQNNFPFFCDFSSFSPFIFDRTHSYPFNQLFNTIKALIWLNPNGPYNYEIEIVALHFYWLYLIFLFVLFFDLTNILDIN